jgi:hypothetical protein
MRGGDAPFPIGGKYHGPQGQILAGQLRVDTDRDQAAAPEGSQQSPLRLNTRPSGWVIQLLYQATCVNVVTAAFDSDRPLTHRRQHPAYVEHFPDVFLQAQTPQSRFRQDDRVIKSRVQFPQAGLHIASQLNQV